MWELFKKKYRIPFIRSVVLRLVIFFKHLLKDDQVHSLSSGPKSYVTQKSKTRQT